MPLQAEGEFSGSLSFTTDYIYRGYSKNDGNPVGQANIDYEHSSGLFLGTWVSTVDFADDSFRDPSDVEISPYLGWAFQVSDDWRLDAQWTRYIYDGRIFNNASDFNEYYLIANFRDLLTATFSVANDAFGQDEFTYNYEIDVRYPVTDTLQASTGVGFYQALEALDYDYLYWNFGFTWFYKFAALDFRYVDSAQVVEKAYKRSAWQFDPEALAPTFLFTLTLGF